MNKKALPLIIIAGVGLGVLAFSGAFTKKTAVTTETAGMGYGMGSDFNFAGNPYAGNMAENADTPSTNIYNFPAPDVSSFLAPLPSNTDSKKNTNTSSGGGTATVDYYTSKAQKEGTMAYVSGQGVGSYDASTGVFVNGKGQGMSVMPNAVKKPTLNNIVADKYGTPSANKYFKLPQ